MRLKYKKMILLLTMGVMGIGMLTISFDKTSQADTGAVKTVSDLVVNSTKDIVSKDMPAKVPTPGTNSSITPTLALEDPLKLKLNDNPELNNLVKTYYSAMLDTDEDTLSSIVTDPSVINIEVINKKLEYISNIHNIVCYTKPGVNEGDYVVYVAYDMEIASIDTYGPSLDYLYITSINDKLYVKTGVLDEKIQTLRNEYFNTQEVKDLLKSVNQALTEACKSDQALQEFFDNLTTSIKASESDSTTESSDDAPAN